MRGKSGFGDIRVKIPPEKLQELQRLLADIPNGVNKAVAKATNKAVERARVEAMLRIRDRYAISPSALSLRLKVNRASVRNPTAMIVWSSPEIAITKFKTKPTKPASQSGIPVALRRAPETEIVKGQKKSWPHAFLAVMKSSHKGLFARERKTSLPIKQFFGPSVASMIGQRGVLKAITEATNAVIVEELEKQVTRMLSVRRRT